MTRETATGTTANNPSQHSAVPVLEEEVQMSPSAGESSLAIRSSDEAEYMDEPATPWAANQGACSNKGALNPQAQLIFNFQSQDTSCILC